MEVVFLEEALVAILTVQLNTAVSHASAPVTFPVGNGTAYTTAGVEASSASAETYTIEYKTGTPHSGGLDWANYPAGVPVSGSNVVHMNNEYYVDIARAGSVDAYIRSISLV